MSKLETTGEREALLTGFFRSQAERTAMLAERSRMLAYISKLQGIIKVRIRLQASLVHT